MSGVVLEGVQKFYGRTEVVRGISFTAGQGQFVTMLGPSGCGKSTTLNMIAGLEDLSGGSISIGGQRVEDVPPDRRDIAFVFQDYALYPHMSVYDNMAFGLKMRKTPRAEIKQRVTHAAERLSIAHLLRRKPKQLSGGQRQRVALGRSIVRRPQVFLFDEPLSNLDALIRDQTRAEIKRLHTELGATSIYVTHDQEEAMTLSDLIVVLNDGRIEQLGSPAEIYHQPVTEFVAGFVGKPRMNLADGVVESGRVTIAGSGVELPTTVSAHGSVRVGIRPENIAIRTSDTTGAVPVSVEFVEPVGASTDVHVRAGERLFTIRTPGISAAQPGDTLWLDFSTASLHLFDTETGHRLS